MSFPAEFQDVTVCVAKLIVGINEAKEDDGRVSFGESAMIAAAITPDVVKAIKGVGQIPKELMVLSKEDLDAVYFDFLTRLDWTPSDDARDKFSIAYDIGSALVIGAIKYRNTVKPPKAQIIP